MAEFETYKGMKRLSTTPVGDGGQALNENFTAIGDELEHLGDIAEAAELLAGSNITTGVIGSFNVTDSSQGVTGLAANVNRERVVLTNLSDETIYIALGDDAVVGQGIALASEGGAISLSGGKAKLAVNAIHGETGNKALAWQSLATE